MMIDGLLVVGVLVGAAREAEIDQTQDPAPPGRFGRRRPAYTRLLYAKNTTAHVLTSTADDNNT